MQLLKLIPGRNGVESAAFLLLCLAIICFPFSVAAANLFLGLLLAVGIFAGFWRQGAGRLWRCDRRLFVALIAYLALVCLGLLWSLDPAWGGRILGRHWFWLLLPVVVMILSHERNRRIFLATMSLGLTANLIFCVLQANGLIDSPSVAGSTPVNATGHIGHTSFGFIYGIWAGWLLHVGLLYGGRVRWPAWALSGWALVMVFLTEGKSGYMIALTVMILVAIKWLKEAGNMRMFASFVSVLLLLAVIFALGPARDRMLGTWQVLTDTVQADLSNSQKNAVSSVKARLEWWKMSYQMWLNKPNPGVGTGGYPLAVADWKAGHAAARDYDVALVHPHNQYLLSLVRWGLAGLILLLALLYCWIRAGLSVQWRHSVATPLIALTGSALLVHGLSSASLEEHFSTIFAMLLLGAGLSERTDRKV